MPENKPYDVPELEQWLMSGGRLLYAMANRPEEFYHSFTIPKRNGTPRRIEAPRSVLKTIQRRILHRILENEAPSPYATAFRRHSGIRENAGWHVRAPAVLSLDIENFFPSLSAAWVHTLFASWDFTPRAAVLLTRLCCYRGHLPQGAPTSPYLSNLLLRKVDHDIAVWCAAHQVQFSRYADDITLSGDLPPPVATEAIAACRDALRPIGLKLNRAKQKLRRQGQRQWVTGLVVNDAVHVPREQIRALRQAVHRFEHSYTRRNREELAHWLGVADFIYGIQPEMPRIAAWREQLRNWLGQCPQRSYSF